ncbi:LysM domain-containing GPI-anchored protein 2 [Morus notabilis]|uniref:LysM domain-containing GPI-anchored protein 2 n=1 Tax=Morus notabilis TaxID=981085 RepID=W9RWA2_9ROSA|nr:lysM domain-containing GPI-anchored protein 2 [Morus notabilis]EXB95407.1 LysM domain-containing GPI-anchored protein 2 [Morus notabilis]
MASSSSSKVVLLLTLCLISAAAATRTEGSFQCSARATCHALVDYSPTNDTTYSGIKTLFGVKKLDSLLGANNLPTSTPPKTTVAAKQKIRVPFPCLCSSNGTSGVSNKVPVYTVKKGDGLDNIARQTFSGLVTFEEIADHNNISNPDLIEEGQRLWIPLPCSCDEVNGTKVVHYGHLVESGSSVAGIAERFGTTEETLLKLNGMANASALQADQVLDVPLEACSSSVRTDSLDSPLLVPNGTYVLTAYRCVKCNCNSANNWVLQCEASQLNPTNWSTCPSTQCSDSSSFSIVNTTSSTTCGSGTTCAYAGFNKTTIFTTQVQQPNCPASNNTNAASKMVLHAWSSNFLFISIHLVLLLVFFL